MPIPDFQSAMLPTLDLLKDGGERHRTDFVEHLAMFFGVTDAERLQMLPSGVATVLASRSGWALTYLKAANLVESPKRAVFRITEVGRALLVEKPARIDLKLLERYPGYMEFKARSRSRAATDATTETVDLVSETPEDALARAYTRLRDDLESELLQQIKSYSPEFFERLVIDLLLAMGYGGSRADAGRAIGKSGDGGIDGVINEDRLGLDVIYVQAKKWEGSVGRPELQKFAGALHGERANKGVFITTSMFTKDAIEYVRSISTRIILIDGDTLVSHMFDYGVGVTRVGSYDVKRIDSDYFDQ